MCDLSSFLCGSGPNLDDFVEYELYFDDLPTRVAEQRRFLEERLLSCLASLANELNGQLWHRDPFHLEVCISNVPPSTNISNKMSDKSPDDSFGSAAGSEACLKGYMRVGDSVDDEWYVVHLLLTLTGRHEGSTATVRDRDGEFLLIESALSLPHWLDPVTARNRVFIRGGCLQLLPRQDRQQQCSAPTGVDRNNIIGVEGRTRSHGSVSDNIEPSTSSGELNLTDALQIIRNDDRGRCVAKSSTQRSILTRTRKCVELRGMNITHYANCVMPRAIANLFCMYPQLVSLAIDYLPPEVRNKTKKTKVTAVRRYDEWVPITATDNESCQGDVPPVTNNDIDWENVFSFKDQRVPSVNNPATSSSSSTNSEGTSVVCTSGGNTPSTAVLVRIRFTRQQYSRFTSLKFKSPPEFSLNNWTAPASATSATGTLGTCETPSSNGGGGSSSRGSDKLGKLKRRQQSNYLVEMQRGAYLCLGLKEAYLSNIQDDCLAFLWKKPSKNPTTVTKNAVSEVVTNLKVAYSSPPYIRILDLIREAECTTGGYFGFQHVLQYNSPHESSFKYALQEAYKLYMGTDIPEESRGDGLPDDSVDWMNMSVQDVDAILAERQKEENAFKTFKEVRRVIDRGCTAVTGGGSVSYTTVDNSLTTKMENTQRTQYKNNNSAVDKNNYASGKNAPTVISQHLNKGQSSDATDKELMEIGNKLEAALQKMSDYEGAEFDVPDGIGTGTDNNMSAENAIHDTMDVVQRAMSAIESRGDNIDLDLFQQLLDESVLPVDSDDGNIDDDDLLDDGDEDEVEEGDEDPFMVELMKSMDDQLQGRSVYGKSNNEVTVDAVKSLYAAVQGESPLEPGPASTLLASLQSMNVPL
eukprot:Lankesteria_metandrocarpae@DN4741_c0_g1_i1.p1